MALKYRAKIKEQAFGLDIGDSGVRLAQVYKDAQEVGLKLLSFKDFPIRLEPTDRLTLINSLKEIMQKSGINSRKAIVNLYGTNPIIKFLHFPHMSDEEIGKAIKWEVSKSIVYELDKMIIDYAVVNQFEEDGKKKISVIVVACAKDIVLNEINILKEADIDPVSIDVDALAQIYMAQANEVFSNNENLVFIEIGSKKMDINVIDKGVPCFRRECSTIGSMDITRALKEGLNIDLLEAEKIKQELSLRAEEITDKNINNTNSIAREVLGRSIMEIRRSLDYYMDSFPQKTINKVVLTGGGACLKNIANFLSNQLGISTEVINPLKNIKLSDNIPDIDIIKTTAPRFCTVVGLALEAFNNT